MFVQFVFPYLRAESKVIYYPSIFFAAWIVVAAINHRSWQLSNDYFYEMNAWTRTDTYVRICLDMLFNEFHDSNVREEITDKIVDSVFHSDHYSRRLDSHTPYKNI